MICAQAGMCAFWPMSRKTTEWYKINVVCRAERTNVGPNDEKKSGIRRTGSDLRAFGIAYDKTLAEIRFVNRQHNLLYWQLSSVKATSTHDTENLAFNGDDGERGHPLTKR
jgi:hypothetical protein